MSSRLQVLVPESLDRRIRKAAQRRRLSTGAWVRQALEQALKEDRTVDPLDRLSGLGAPTGDIDQMLAEIESGRGLMVFVDSNVPMYVAGRDHPLRDPARRFLERARGGHIDICTSTEILQEILYRYAGLKRLDLAAAVYDLFVQLCPTVLPVALADTDRAKELLTTVGGLSARDAVHAAVMLNHDISQIATFDEGFDRVVGVTRVKMG